MSVAMLCCRSVRLDAVITLSHLPNVHDSGPLDYDAMVKTRSTKKMIDHGG
jgi:hypothetical protein